MIDIKDWKWEGLPGHFICGHLCSFRLHTQIGNYLISTVGEYHPNGIDTPAKEIGYKRFFETMVFDLTKSYICECGCNIRRPKNLSELDMIPANTHTEAKENHMKTCFEYASKE